VTAKLWGCNASNWKPIKKHEAASNGGLISLFSQRERYVVMIV
jgi:hypothetical protein